VPYLAADAERIKFWKSRLPAKVGKKIGLVWAGKRQHPNDYNRSISLDLLAPLAEIPKTFFVSLQKSDDGKVTAPFELADWTAELTDFADTAALMAHLDLVITVDTAAAHLAGAMGKPAWVLIPFRPDWRWMLRREDSPWYPTLRLFRQERIGDWSSPIEQIRHLLKSTVKKNREGAKTRRQPRRR
jgi:Glycosyltransferase family 9 (heptosyltransferase)